jgi:hypothetical protein
MVVPSKKAYHSVQRLSRLFKGVVLILGGIVATGIGLSTVLVLDGNVIPSTDYLSSLPMPATGENPGGGEHHCLNDDFQPNERIAVWTMLNDNKDYVQGAIKIGKSIHAKTKTPVDLVVMELQHKLLTDQEWTELRAVGWQRCTVEPIPAPQKTRRDLKEKFAVLHVWAMTVYDRVIFLDADSFPQNSLDGLIHMDLQGKAVGVTKDIRQGTWVETFNSGVLLLHPSIPEFQRLLQLLGSGLVFDYVMSDQGFLNEVYKDNWHEIGFVYNANLALYRFQRAFWDSHKLEDINIIHYTMSKPWKCSPTGTYGPICQIWHDAE